MKMEEYLFINSRDEFLRLNIHQIVYLEADGNYTNIISANKLKSVVSMTLGKMQNLLSEKLKEKASVFARVGKRYIINLNYIHSINILHQKLILSDEHTFAFQLNISKDALKALKVCFIEMAVKEQME